MKQSNKEGLLRQSAIKALLAMTIVSACA